MDTAEQHTIPTYDLFVIGGGINGTGIARDAAGRGLSVFLCEKGDLAQGTSSASSKMIHGGLRYLEYYEFRLVREALIEREVLLGSAPHIIWPVEFVMPFMQGLRPAWLIRLGLFLYDHLARRKRLSGSYGVDLVASRFGRPLKKYLKKGFVYSDCWVEDSRLTVLAAVDAAKHGAHIHSYTQFLQAEKEGDRWRIGIRTPEGQDQVIYAKYIINAGGPSVARIAKRIIGSAAVKTPRLIRGSHLVVKRFYEGEHAYLLQHPDRRVIFAIPFEDDYIMIGTTDKPATDEDIEHPKITAEETDYLLEAANIYFAQSLTREDIAFTYSGIRPLYDDGEEDASKITRDYSLNLEGNCLTVYGGKITTFRRLAEEAVERVIEDMGITRPRWTAQSVLPGGNIPASLTQYTQQVLEHYPFLPEDMAARLATQYGDLVHDVLGKATSLGDLGQHFGDHLYAQEVDYLVTHEWARKADDVLIRRTRLGMHAKPETREKLEAYLRESLKEAWRG